MIRLTNLADYAVVLMSELARTDKRANASDLAAASGIPEPTVSKILGQMKRAGLLASSRGVKGGFSLAQPPAEISVADVIEAVDGPIALTNCVSTTERECTLEPVCSMAVHWQTINEAVRGALAGITLHDISKPGPVPAFSRPLTPVAEPVDQ